MHRRDFLKAVGAMAIVPAAAVTITPAHVGAAGGEKACATPPTPQPDHPIFSGEIGRYEGIRFITSNQHAAKIWGRRIDQDTASSKLLRLLMDRIE